MSLQSSASIGVISTNSLLKFAKSARHALQAPADQTR
jgi:hypothetical protein